MKKILPIQSAKDRRSDYDAELDMVLYLPQQSLPDHPDPNKTMGALFPTFSIAGDWFMDEFVKLWSKEEAVYCIENALNTYDNLDKLPLLH